MDAQFLAAETLCLLMFAGTCLLLLAGFPVAFTLGGTALLFAGLGAAVGHFDPAILSAIPQRIFGIMTNDVVVMPAHLSVSKARRLLRQRLREPDFVYFVYVVDDDERRHLLGVVSLRELLVAEDPRPLAELLETHLITLDPLESAGSAARRVVESGLVALPVVSPEGRLLGAVTFDAAVARVAPASWAEQMPRVFS